MSTVQQEIGSVVRNIRERQIFPYFNGRGDVLGDPLAIRRRMIRAVAPDDFDAISKEARELPLAVADNSIEKLLVAIRAGFGLAEFDPETGEGLTEGEVFDVLRSFYAWEASLGESGGGNPSTSPSTDIPPTS